MLCMVICTALRKQMLKAPEVIYWSHTVHAQCSVNQVKWVLDLYTHLQLIVSEHAAVLGDMHSRYTEQNIPRTRSVEFLGRESGVTGPTPR